MILAAIERITIVYVMNVKTNPDRVPFGIDLLGFFRSPDIEAPLYHFDVSTEHALIS